MNRILLMVLRNLGFVPGAYAKLCRYAKNTDKYSRQEMYDHVAMIMQRAVKSGNLELVCTGVENIPTEGGVMLYGNHQGMFDIVALAATCPLPLAAVLKKELETVPFIRQVMLCTGSYPMDREDVRQSLRVIQAVTKEVQDGRRFVIFPEGTRSKNGNVMGDFHGGSFRCALKAKCPIVPMCFIDCFKPLDQKGSKPLKVQLHYLPVIPYEEYKDMTTVQLAALVKQRIQECIDANT